MDPQLLAARQAARDRGAISGLPPELLNLPISALLEDGPTEIAPPIKRRCLEPGQLRVPPERTDEIRRALQERVARRRPFAVLLQEVVPPALELLSSEKVLGGSYEVVVPKDPPMFVVSGRLGPPTTVPFPSTRMGRQLLCVTLQLAGGDSPLLLATAHLESTKDHAAERRRQMLQSLRHLRSQVGKPPAAAPAGTAPVGAAVFGGDLNARDDDVREVMQQLGADGAGVADAWVHCGSPAAARYTWDTVENTNVGASFSCRTRFDRVLFLSPGVSDRGPAPKAKARGKAKAKAAAPAVEAAAPAEGWRPTAVSLVGRARVPGLGRFPSDHWGVLTVWAAGGPAAAAAAAATTGPASAASRTSTGSAAPAACAFPLAPAPLAAPAAAATASAAFAASKASAESAAPAACALPLAPAPVDRQPREFAALTTGGKHLVIDLGDED
ncbi:unnamed protein product [Prorocentrum cordatum]|uniref:Nocturnin n=1 Tax=Prorocentrum cordatum TaxID=2364126 RepID=A0ABN9PEN7_9DINO|nr:unnamed protein product [Polarella glacialis]